MGRPIHSALVPFTLQFIKQTGPTHRMYVLERIGRPELEGRAHLRSPDRSASCTRQEIQWAAMRVIRLMRNCDLAKPVHLNRFGGGKIARKSLNDSEQMEGRELVLFYLSPGHIEWTSVSCHTGFLCFRLLTLLTLSIHSTCSEPLTSRPKGWTFWPAWGPGRMLEKIFSEWNRGRFTRKKKRLAVAWRMVQPVGILDDSFARRSIKNLERSKA